MTPPNPQRNGEKAGTLRDLPDRDLILRCQKGESQAFNELVTRHQDKVYNVVFRFCGNQEDAADVTQRAFINAYRKIQDFKGDAAFSTWIYRIAFNQAVSFRREHKRDGVSLYSRDDELITEPAESRNPTEGMEADETRKKVQQALELLEEGDRQIILLKDLQGYSYDEIAGIMQVPKGTVRSRLHRARLELKAKLKSFIGTLQ